MRFYLVAYCTRGSFGERFAVFRESRLFGAFHYVCLLQDKQVIKDTVSKFIITYNG